MQVADVVGSALRLRNDVIDAQVPDQEVMLAAQAVAALLAVQELLVPGMVVAQDFSHIGAPGNVRSVGDGAEQRHSVAGVNHGWKRAADFRNPRGMALMLYFVLPFAA